MVNNLLIKTSHFEIVLSRLHTHIVSLDIDDKSFREKVNVLFSPRQDFFNLNLEEREN